MNSRVLLAAVIGGGMVALLVLRSTGPYDPGATGSHGGGSIAEKPPAQPAGGRTVADLARRVDTLATQLAAETAERRRLEARLDAMSAQLPAAAPAPEMPVAQAARPHEPSNGSAGADAVAANENGDAANANITPLERALVAAGIDPAVAADVKRRQDEASLAEIYLRDQATREGWIDSSRFQDELARVQQQRVSIRDEIGDDSYDRYLTALGEPNRVRVAEVLTASPAEAVGLQAGDVVLRYGDTRIFAPDDLVTETRSGTAGEPVRVEILRAGQRFDIEVPRGPLGLRIAASQANPDEG